MNLKDFTPFMDEDSALLIYKSDDIYNLIPWDDGEE